MSLPILQPSTIDTTQIRGDVTIDQSVIIAKGVILNATNGNKIVLCEGVCVGMGTIITASEGDIYIQENTILGSGSLIFGSCIIGQQVSLGASVTVYNAKVEAMSVIPAGSIIGDRSRQIDLKEEVKVNSQTQTIIDGVKKGFSQNIKTDNQAVTEVNHNQGKENKNVLEENEQKSSTDKEIETEIFNTDVWEEKTPQGNNVVGQVYINKLLFTLFPEKQNKPK
jgi:carbon dioxide concentrating mechanism protein CcmN